MVLIVLYSTFCMAFYSVVPFGASLFNFVYCALHSNFIFNLLSRFTVKIFSHGLCMTFWLL